MVVMIVVLFFNETAPPEIYTYGHTLSLHDALPSYPPAPQRSRRRWTGPQAMSPPIGRVNARSRRPSSGGAPWRSEEHTSELQSLMRTSYAVFCLNKKNKSFAKIADSYPSADSHEVQYSQVRHQQQHAPTHTP